MAFMALACDGSAGPPKATDAGAPRLDTLAPFEVGSHDVPHVPARDAPVPPDSSPEAGETDVRPEVSDDDGATTDGDVEEAETAGDAEGETDAAPEADS